MFRMVWRPTVAGVSFFFFFFWRICVLEFYLILISVTLSVLCSWSRATRFCLFATGARHYTLFNLARLSAFSIFFSDTKRWHIFLYFSDFWSRLRTCASLFFGPQNLIPTHLTFYFSSDTTRYHGPHLKSAFVFIAVSISFVSYLPAFWYRRDGILIGMGWYQNLEPRPHGQ